MMNFCTLFDSNYLDKGLALYNSLLRVTNHFSLYILCFDQCAYDVLTNMELKHIKVESLDNFETEELLKIKPNRTKAEYCWTCTAATIAYFMDKYHLDDLTYIDADLYFYSDPQCLFEEINSNYADVAIMEHRFENSEAGMRSSQTSGKYCVEFNYFKNTENGKQALRWWKQACFEWCYHKYEPEQDGHPARYGDQKYLEQLPILFDHVHVMKHLGAGVAPWNLRQYQIRESNGAEIQLQLIETKQTMPLIFYHFQNLKYITHELVNINSMCHDKILKENIYHPYLKEITEIRNMLAIKYHLVLDIKKSYSSNKLKAFIQKYIMPYRLRVFSDLVNLKKLN